MKKDHIVILVADSNIKGCLDGLLQRLPMVFDLAPYTYEIFSHPQRDPGCRIDSTAFLRRFKDNTGYALVVFDKEGCGKELSSRTELEEDIEKSLSISGWDDRAKVIVIDPELENWVWIKSPRLAQIINWESIENLYNWIENNGFTLDERHKPLHPKEAFEKALYTSRKRRSSSIYTEIASQVSFRECTDQSFNKLINCMKFWFLRNHEDL